MISHGVEISIAGGGGEMVRAYLLVGCSSFFFLYQVFIVTVQELACSASYSVNKTSISKTKKQTKIIKSSANRVKYSTHRHLTANKRKDNHKKPQQPPTRKRKLHSTTTGKNLNGARRGGGKQAHRARNGEGREDHRGRGGGKGRKHIGWVVGRGCPYEGGQGQEQVFIGPEGGVWSNASEALEEALPMEGCRLAAENRMAERLFLFTASRAVFGVV